MAHTIRLAATAILLGGAGASAFDARLDPAAIADAIRIGQSRIERLRDDFHRPYRVDVRRPPVDYIDVVTPFRRVELAAEERARAGDQRFTQRDAFAVLVEQGGRLTLFVELTFHPQHAYVGVPPYTVSLAPAGSAPPVAPIDVQRVPRYGERVSGTALPYPRPPVLPPGIQPMLGGTVIADFEGGRLDARGVYEAVLEESGKEVARARVDLGSLR